MDTSFLPSFREKRKPSGVAKLYYEKIEKPKTLSFVPLYYKQYGLPVEFVQKQLKNISNPDVILVTCMMTYWYPGAFKAIKLLKEFFPGTPVIFGGIYVNLCPEHAKKFSGADFITPNYTEKQILDLINRLTGNKEQNFSFTRLPFSFVKNPNYACLLTSRGCPFSCSYCASRFLHPDFIQLPAENLIEEIEFYYYNLKITNFVFYDDALLVNFDNHLKKILLKLKNIKANFYTPNGLHAKFINEEVARIFFEMGFKSIFMGLETIIEKRQAETGNKVNNNQLIKAVKNLQKAGFTEKEIGVYILIGLPGQTVKEAVETIEFVKNNSATPFINGFSPIPNTPDWEKANSGLIHNPEADPVLHNNSLFPYNSKAFTPEIFNELKQICKKAYTDPAMEIR